MTPARSFTAMVKTAAARAALALAGLCAAGAAHAENPAMLVKIDAGGESYVSKPLVLPLNKAAIIELPSNAADVLVSQPEVVDAVVRTSRKVYLLGRQVGQTNAFFFDESGEQILNLEIRVERDLDALSDMMRRFIPTGRIELEAVNDNIVLAGAVDSSIDADRARDLAARFVGEAERVMSMLTIRANEQVMIKVRVAEMQRSLVKQLGLDVEGALSVEDSLFEFANSSPLTIPNGLSAGFQNPLNIGGFLRNFNVEIDALERVGLVRTLAEPTLTAISGEGATFLAGGEFPLARGLDQNGNAIFELQPFGVSLGFKPVVLSGGRISLEVATEVSEISQENAQTISSAPILDPVTGELIGTSLITVPGLNVRRTETTVELPSGGSIVLAGLLQQDLRQTLEGVPGVKDLPVLGQLFRSRDYLNDVTELVIMATPYLVKPVNRGELTDGTEGFVPASDAETLLLGRLNAVYGNANENPDGPRLQGPVGFVLD
ncbi:MAG: type II and III secretion system protein family protein [Pseudomonadota bacterium]